MSNQNSLKISRFFSISTHHILMIIDYIFSDLLLWDSIVEKIKSLNKNKKSDETGRCMNWWRCQSFSACPISVRPNGCMQPLRFCSITALHNGAEHRCIELKLLLRCYTVEGRFVAGAFFERCTRIFGVLDVRHFNTYKCRSLLGCWRQSLIWRLNKNN